MLQELVKQNLISEEAAKKLLNEASLVKRGIEDLIYERRLIDEEKLASAKSQILKVPYKKIKVEEIPEDVLKLIPEETVRNYKAVPVSQSGDTLIVGMLNPDDPKAQDALKFIARQIKTNLGVYLISPSAWEAALRRYSPYRSEVEAAVKSLNLISMKDSAVGRIIQLEESGKTAASEEAPIIKIVASTLKEAVWQKASDIHIEPQRNRLRIRFRIDGELQEVSSMPLELHQPIVSRIKVLSNLKIDENRIPQDGRFRTVLFGRDIDYRVATFPTPVGEKAAVRVLDPSVGLKGLEELGLVGKNLETVKNGIKKPYGMILITGPTGSGKTTTLYAVMRDLNKEAANIVSLEDPVEYFIDGLNQSQVRPEIGYDFASGLRQILRQDPDIIMVGEIRDNETAGLAIHAALTGHIVLSTLHTNDAAGVIPRLIDMKVEPFLLPSSLNLMLAQRLVSRLCQQCKKAEKAPAEISEIIKKELEKLPKEIIENSKFKIEDLNIYHSSGCPVCKNKGVSGRVALFEILEMTPQLENIVSAGLSESKILEEAKRQGMISLRQDGILKALQGLVSIEEVLRETTEI
ncbi:MAG: type II secretion system protein E [Candidatus Wolfebacteria bacterium GW2011_GWA2_42_10]|uniref:Type II secretion system protein E n=2 Tax=Candidatus Wolfeibacteriota TaxID=1752735 RepID=A0A0G1AID0_9BACT|nr:MAG: type II secretion system protein E [Candidatus Wolfebacteria bacterium GW2011_GWB1_41_12]KKS25048.1 MAG: type II secretion system protein E [Candidatus Wolfebacteria bacterium GW2011_GWA2_42_10]KKT56361.1 MAG: type II secretion system protein E [Candidatus Wolfebacteria bacterium GW2011_GWA1_44_24]